MLSSTRHYTSFLMVLIFLSFFDLGAQSRKKVDSLLLIVNKHATDSVEVNALDDLSSEYENGDLVISLRYAKEALELAQKIDYKLGILRAWNQTGNVLSNCAQYDEALKYYQKAIDNAPAWGFPEQSIRSFANVANVNRMKGNHGKAIEIYLMALKNAEKNNDKVFYGSLLNYIGMVYEEQGDLKKARDYFKQAITTFLDLKDSTELAKPLVDLGNIYGQSGHFDSALVCYKEAFSIYQKNNNVDGISTALGNMGIAYAESGNMEESYKSFKTSLEIALKNGDLNGACISYLNFGNFYMITKNYNKAISSLNDGVMLASKINSGPRLMNLYELLSDVNSIQGNYEEAYRYHVLFTQFKDSVLNEDNAKRIAQLQAVFDSEKKETELEKRKAEINKQTTQKIAFGTGLCLSVVLLFFVVRGYFQKRKNNLELSEKNKIIEMQKETVEEKQREILDSIKYARRIQKAMLPHEKYINKNLNRIRNGKD